MWPGTYDYLGWITSALAMSNGGEVFYTAPSTIGAVKLIDSLVHKCHFMPEGVTDANAVTTAFFQGRTAIMVLSTGSLSSVRENMKAPYRVAFLPLQFVNAVPIGIASLIIPRGNSPERQAAAWTLIDWPTSPEIAGGWGRFTGYFAPRIAAYDLPEMKTYVADHPDAKVALDHLANARGWFATYNVVGVRKAFEDGVQAELSGKAAPEAAMARAQAEAEALMKPYVEQTALKLPE
jgi:sn-glycerol 3-phosphate transport system substrate-binding protein